MPITAKIDQPAQEQKPITFPVLMEYIGTGRTREDEGVPLLVLFFAPNEGTRLTASDIHHSSAWVPCTNKLNWRPFKGSITLSNEA